MLTVNEVNIELPSLLNSLKLLGSRKKRRNIKPMSLIKIFIISNKDERKRYQPSPIFVPGGQSTQPLHNKGK